MLKPLLAAVAVLALSSVVHADSFSVTLAEGNAVITEVNSAVIANPFALFNPTASSDYAAGLATYTAGIAAEALGNLTLADADFIASQGDFNALLKILGSSSTVSYYPAPEPSTLLLLALGLGGLLFLVRKRTPELPAA
jgi:PEP-CTERM motif